MKRLHKSPNNAVIFGVCSGVAEYLGVDPTLVRLVWFGVVLIFGSGILLYLIAALIMPAE